MLAHDRCALAVIFLLIICHISTNVPNVRCELANESTTKKNHPSNVTKSLVKKRNSVTVRMVPLPEITPRPRHWDCCPPGFNLLEDQLFNCYNMKTRDSTTKHELESRTFHCHVMVPGNSNATAATANRTQQTQCLSGLEMQDGRTYKCYFIERGRRRLRVGPGRKQIEKERMAAAPLSQKRCEEKYDIQEERCKETTKQ